ncbi:MAG: hypothetical protein Q9160_008751 [Pyrenula sp. 1 TL-2023]
MSRVRLNTQPSTGTLSGQPSIQTQPGGGPMVSHSRSPSRDRPPIPPAKDFTISDAFSPTTIVQQPINSPASLSPPIGSPPPKDTSRRRSFGFRTSSRKTSYSREEQPSIPQVTTPISDNNSPLTPSLTQDSDSKSSPSIDSEETFQRGKDSVRVFSKRYTNVELWEATGSNERDKIEKLLKAGLNVNHCQWQVNGIASLVDRAIAGKRPDVLALLLRWQPDLSGSVKARYIEDQRRQYGEKWYSRYSMKRFDKAEPDEWIGALHLASKLGHVDTVRQLLKDGKADPNDMDSKARTPLFHAVTSGSTKVLELLLDHGAQIEWTNSINVTPLQASVIRGDLEMVKALVKRGALLDKFDSYGETAVYDAAARGHLEIVNHLAEAGADLDIKNDLGIGAYLKAASKFDDKVMKALADQGADLDTRDRNGCTALIRAVAAGNKPLTALLLQHGLDIDATDNDGWTALDVAMIKRDEDLAAILLLNGANLETKDIMSNTLLHRAAARGTSTITRHLLAVKNQHPDTAKNSTGETPLHLAASQCNGPVTHLLLHYGANPNLTDHNGLTPVHQTLTHGSIAITRELCKHNVDLSDTSAIARLLDSFAADPNADVDRQNRRKQIVRLLQRKGMAIEWPEASSPINSGQSPIPTLTLPSTSSGSSAAIPWSEEASRLQIKRGISKAKPSTTKPAAPAKPKPMVTSRGNVVPSAATTAATVSGVNNIKTTPSAPSAATTASTPASTSSSTPAPSTTPSEPEDPFEASIPKPPSASQIIERYIIEKRGGGGGAGETALGILEGTSAALGIANNLAQMF